MKKVIAGWVLLAGLVGSGTIYTMQTTFAGGQVDESGMLVIPADESPAAKKAEEVMQKTIKAILADDVQGMLKYTHDVRYQRQSDRYKRSTEKIRNDLKEIRIEDVRSVNSSLVMITVRQTDVDDRVSINTLPVYKMKGTWKVITGGSSHPPYKYESSIPQV